MSRIIAGMILGGLITLAPAAATILPPTDAFDPEPSRLDRVPVAISRALPVYPFALRRSGIKGVVVADFVVDVYGNVANVSIISSPHAEFEPPIIEAMLKWKFQPGEKDGRPVNTHMRVPIAFDGISGWQEKGTSALKIPKRAPASAPDEYRYDEPPQPVFTGTPVYPYDLLQEKITGSATIAFAVDPQGQTRQIKISGATKPEFGAAAAAMIATWTFRPAKKAGKPCWALLEKKQTFDWIERDSVTQSAERLLTVLRKNPLEIASLDSLDGALKPRYRPTVVLPEVLRPEEAAEAEIEFIIDYAGHAQLPRVISSSHEVFGWAAAAAVSNWVFMTPTRNGRPVDVRLSFTLVHTPPKPTPEWEK